VKVVAVFPVYATTEEPIWSEPADSKEEVESTVIVEAPAVIAPFKAVETLKIS
jgi:hypothetical protein